MPAWRESFGNELRIGLWVLIPGRNGQRGTKPLTTGWYQIEGLRQDDEGDWIIRFAGNRYHWLFSWDTLPASEEQEQPADVQDFIKRVPADQIRPGTWLYLPAPVNDWFEVAGHAWPSKSVRDEIMIPLVGHEPAVFRAYGKVSVRAQSPYDDEAMWWNAFNLGDRPAAVSVNVASADVDIKVVQTGTIDPLAC